MIQVKIIKGNTGHSQANFIEEIANQWLKDNENSIEVLDIKLFPANGATNNTLLIQYRLKKGKTIKDTAKGQEY